MYCELNAVKALLNHGADLSFPNQVRPSRTVTPADASHISRMPVVAVIPFCEHACASNANHRPPPATAIPVATLAPTTTAAAAAYSAIATTT